MIYRDNEDVLCRRWNWRECNKTKMTENTKNVCLVIEALGSTPLAELKTAMIDLKEKIDKYCGGESHIFFCTENNPKINF